MTVSGVAALRRRLPTYYTYLAWLAVWWVGLFTALAWSVGRPVWSDGGPVGGFAAALFQPGQPFRWLYALAILFVSVEACRRFVGRVRSLTAPPASA